MLPIDATSRRIAATLRGAGYPYRYAEFDGGHQFPPDLAAALAEATGPAHGHPGPSPRPIPLARPIADADGDTLEARLGVAGRKIARWREPACLRIIGASATFMQQVEVEVRSIAAAAGVPYEWGRCRANLTLALHDTRTAPRHSYTHRTDARALASATLTLDKRRAEALRAPAVAAYVALAGFAELPQAKAPPSGTLLALFDRADAPRRLTTLDLDFLRRLYAPPA